MKTCTLEAEHLQALLDALRRRGYTLLGPTLRDGAIVYGELETVRDLPRGWTDRQEAGTYRLERRGDGAFFGYNVGPHSWKQFLHPPALRLWRAERDGGSFRLEPEAPDRTRRAFLAVRACEIEALAVQDQVFLGGPFTDVSYAERRRNTFIVAVNCGQAGATCFCASMGTGPRCREGFDLALTEVVSPERHWFLVEAGTAAGEGVLAEIPHGEATPGECGTAGRLLEEAARGMRRSLDTSDLRDLLRRNLESPVWDGVAERCLACTNCTMVCPTCFCTTVEEATDLSGRQAERWRRWDSCFTGEFTYLHGGSVRASIRSRYRQWLTHKLSTWIDQFGTSGCVGCGRCITWCPAAIDITAEVEALRRHEAEAVEAVAAARAGTPGEKEDGAHA